MAESEIRAKLTLDTSQAGAQMQQFRQKAAYNPDLRSPGEKVALTGEYGTAAQIEAATRAKRRQAQQDRWWASVEKKWSPERQEERGAEAAWLRSSRLARRTGLLQPQQATGTSAIASFINQSLGIGGGQNRPGAGYADFWKSAVPPKIVSSKAPTTAGGAGGPPAGLSALSAMGIPYVSTLARAAFTPWGIAIASAAVGLMAFKKAVRETAEAAERARQLYAKALSSGGLPLGFIAQRSNLARIMGVGEREVYGYAAAFTYLNEKVRWASRIQAETVRPLTALSWEWKILRMNLEATFSAIAVDAAPILQKFAQNLQLFVQGLRNTAFMVTELVRNSPTGRVTDMATRGGSALNAFVAAIARGATTGAAFRAAREAASSPYGANVNQAPMPAAMANRTPGSMWERMGLVVGAGGPSPAQRTAQHTGQMVVLLNRLVQMRAPMSGDRDLNFALGGRAHNRP